MSPRDSTEEFLPAKPPTLALSYGQVMWLLLRLGYGAGVTEGTFHEYLKSLRKLGIPWGGNVNRPGGRTRAQYTYYHIMELALVQSLRVYHVVPDSILREIDNNRAKLYGFYRKAYDERSSGQGSPVILTAKNLKPRELRGLFLDLNIKFSGGQMINFGPLKLLSPAGTLARFAQRAQTVETFLPISLSRLAEQVVTLALHPPKRRRSSPPRGLRFPDGRTVLSRHKR